MEEIVSLVPGATELHAWFGYWPSFHDAEIVSLVLNTNGASILQLYTYNMTAETDAEGYFVLNKHVLVNFRMEEILSLTLSDFSSQNVVFGLVLPRIEEGFQIDIDPCYGMSGTIAAKKLSIEIQPLPAAPE